MICMRKWEISTVFTKLSPRQKLFVFFGASVLVALIFVAVFFNTLGPNIGDVSQDKKIVVISNYSYIPQEARVRYGDVVSWQNRSDTSHTVTFRTLSKTLGPGEIWEWEITPDYFLKGANMYWCDFYKDRGMVGARVVVE